MISVARTSAPLIFMAPSKANISSDSSTSRSGSWCSPPTPLCSVENLGETHASHFRGSPGKTRKSGEQVIRCSKNLSGLNTQDIQCNIVKCANNSLLESADNTAIGVRKEPFTDHYSVEGEIGRGKFATVKLCRDNLTGRKYAAKFLRKRRKGSDCRQDILQEVKMLQMAVTHPHLVDLVEVFETGHELIIVTDYAPGGELFRYVLEDDRFEERLVIRLMRQILEALAFLHDRNIVHLDVKPQNILLTSSLPNGDVKLCDFGFARSINSGEDVRDIIGTPDYVAPEILSYEPIHTACDLWSVGVLAYVLLTGCSPFAGDTKQETFLNISQVNLDFPEDLFGHISEHAIDFVSQLLVRDPSQRPTARHCMSHPWIRVSDPRTVSGTPSGSPSGQRRALSPPSPDCLPGEPHKRCRCEGKDFSESSPACPEVKGHGNASSSDAAGFPSPPREDQGEGAMATGGVEPSVALVTRLDPEALLSRLNSVATTAATASRPDIPSPASPCALHTTSDSIANAHITLETSPQSVLITLSVDQSAPAPEVSRDSDERPPCEPVTRTPQHQSPVQKSAENLLSCH